MRTPQDLKLPAKFKSWRPGQAELIEQIAESQAKIFLLDSPTGTGKSVVAISVHQSRVLSKNAMMVLARLSGKTTQETARQFEHRCIYVTRTKQLQDQILFEFSWAKTIKGRNNYPCLKHPKDFPGFTAEDCTKTEDNPCDLRPGCPYYVEKQLALESPLAVLNTSYFLAETNGPGQFSGANLVILDEIDTIEAELMNQIQLKVTTKQLKQFNLEPPKDTTLQGWMIWADAFTAYSEVTRWQEYLDATPESQWSDVELGLHKRLNKLKGFQAKVATFVREVNENWIFSEEEEDGETTWVFKPVLVREYAESYLWKHGKRFLGMSGTILCPQVMADDLGITDWDYARTDCPFPLKNRLIYYQPVVNLTNKTMQDELPNLALEVSRLLDRYPNEKMLIHTTSFLIRDYLMKNIDNTRLMSHDSRNRGEKLEEFKGSPDPLVMVSPSFDRGVDLVDDLCRCIIICKVPYLNLINPQVKARMRMPGGELWYGIKAAQTIMQMTGRGVRSDSDYCDCYILDRQFGLLMSRLGKYLPQWWKDAIRRLE